MTNYMENRVVDAIFRAQPFSESIPANYYVGLLKVACSDSLSGTEVTGIGYQRSPVVRSVSAWKSTNGATTGVSSGTSGLVSNASTVVFPQALANWGIVTHWGIYDASSAGNLLICAPLLNIQNITYGTSLAFGIGSLTFQIDN